MTGLAQEGWKVVSLGDVCDIYQPKTISAKQMVPDGPYPVFGANGVIGRYTEYNHEEPQLLVTCRGATCGSVNLSDPFSWITGNAMVVRPKVADLSLRYVEYFFRGAVDLDGVITGAAQPQITRKSLAPVCIGYPPLEEQQRIVAILDEAFEGLDRARAHAEANLTNARELFESSLKTSIAIGRPDWRNLSVAKSMTRTKVPAKIKRKAYKSEGLFPIISQEAALISGYWDNKDDVVSVERPLVIFGDHTRAVKYVDFDFVVGADGTQLMAPIDAIDPRFYFFALKAIDLESKGYARHFSQLKKCEIGFPDAIEDQQEIASTLDELWVKTQALETQYNETRQDLEDLRQSLLQKAFAGELTRTEAA